MSLQYLDYEESRTVPNIVVDGSPNDGTVLSLTHWPGYPAPLGLARDLSAEMAFAYLDAPAEHPPAEVVTNNHFDQDGLVSIFALVDPAAALPHRALLIDVAAAGDFGTYRDRRAARASMVLSRYAEDEPPDCTYGAFTDRLYRHLLPRLLDVVLDNDGYRELWEEEEDALSASESAIATGRVTITEDRPLDLAIVTIDPSEPARSGHRFGGQTFGHIHPMAINNATDRFRLLIAHGRRYQFVDRYETWVQYQSRVTLPRVDMRPLAERLTAIEHDGAVWSAGAPGALSPHMTHTDESSIDPDTLRQTITAWLANPV